MIDIKIKEKGMNKVLRKLKRLQDNAENIDNEIVVEATSKKEAIKKAIKKTKKKLFKGV